MADIGTHTTKAGYAGEDTPKAWFPSVSGRRLRRGQRARTGCIVLQTQQQCLCMLAAGVQGLSHHNQASNAAEWSKHVSPVFLCRLWACLPGGPTAMEQRPWT